MDPEINMHDIPEEDQPQDFDFNFDFDIEEERIHKPLKLKSRTDKFINYNNAVQLALDIDLKRGSRHFGFISGNFIFGDFIEALIVEKDWLVSEMTIATLSLSEDNIYNLWNLINGEYLTKLNVIISDYFYAHERTKLMKKLYKVLDDPRCEFQLAVARSHAKTCIFKVEAQEDHAGQEYSGHVVIQTSSNLRSSDNLEQLQVEENEELYNFIYDFQKEIMDRFKTINRTVGGKNQWDDLIK